MSLHQLRDMRRQGHRPVDVVLIVGKPPKWFEDGPGYVVIDRDPEGMDLSVLVGMPLHLIDIQYEPSLTERVMDATTAAGAKPIGACSWAGACGGTPEYEAALMRFRSGLCKG